MLFLPKITLLAVDTVSPHRTLESMRRTLSLIRPGAAVLATDPTRFGRLRDEAAINGIELFNHKQSDKIVRFNGIPRNFYPDYELAVMTIPLKCLLNGCTHVLFMEHDSGVLNPLAWDEKWMEFDYIGAPWPPHTDPGWPSCDGITNAVGNGGFSLRSKRLQIAIAELLNENREDPHRFIHDSWLCRTMRPELEQKYGIRFSDPESAAKFSCENRVYAGSFGFHGRSTMELNGWGSWLKTICQ